MTRAPVKLSREMKVLLGLLLLVAAIGVYYLLTKPSADDLASQPQPPVVTGGPGDDTIPVTPAEPDPATGETPGVAVQPDAQVEVEVIPPFPTDGVATDPTAPAPGDVPPTPAGINPEGTLAAVPGNNPFRPLQVTGDSSAPAGQTPAPVTPDSTAPDTTASVPTPVVPAVDPLGSTGGPLGISPLPGANGSESSSGGAVPVPVIPGGDGSTGPVAQPVVVTPIPGGDPVVVNPGQTAPAQPAPVKPPVAGVSVPGVTSIPALTASTGGATNGTGGATNGTGGVTNGTGGTPATATPAPGTPQVITDLGSGNASVPALNELDAFVQTQELAFNAVVLGPVNTAIFRSKDGFVVVSVGQKLPDTQVTVKEVTATGATLSLGNNSRTLELDKR
ncbi:hypothetical protein GCM10017784_02570 [Deinococcus indicus]|uniref:hypothetical protein n=1 Tax=Deinococcus indicus TaxID=223556 RepID=UPI0017496029|nr:hypothetical protein [Deinococcus indicus]GHG15459.1 hypothetical protein GCM10017784_02570 [Deinococcus indicus]